MKYYQNIDDIQIQSPSDSAVISLGKFDGLHIGHRLLMDRLAAGRQDGLTSIAVTFDVPPNALDGKEVKVLSTKKEKEWVFGKAGVDILLELPFTKELRSMEPEDFLSMITGKIPVSKIVCGTDFRFGKNRKGDYRTLQQCGEVFGYEAEIVEKVQDQGADISSTRIREAVKDGRIEEANRLLGYAYFALGEVVTGNRLGRTIQVPTANLLPPPGKLLPPNGGYATFVEVDGKRYGGITNIGYKPTVGDAQPLGIETHLFDFNQDIYGKEIRVAFLRYLRPEQKYESLEALKKQIEQDIWVSKKILAKQPGIL